MTMTEDDIERINKRGPADLEERLSMLTKQVDYMKSKCRQAGRAILELEAMKSTLIKDVDRLSEENSNLKTMLESNERK
jgi:hypothetical protein